MNWLTLMSVKALTVTFVLFVLSLRLLFYLVALCRKLTFRWVMTVIFILRVITFFPLALLPQTVGVIWSLTTGLLNSFRCQLLSPFFKG